MWIPALAVVVIALVVTTRYFWKSVEPAGHGNRAYGLTSQELFRLNLPAEGGHCDAAYKIGRHYMYVSLDYLRAEKYLRIAASCANVDAKLSLINVLRGEQNDGEVDSILLTLRELDRQAWADASKEVEKIRSSRRRQD